MLELSIYHFHFDRYSQPVQSFQSDSSKYGIADFIRYVSNGFGIADVDFEVYCHVEKILKF